jgi:hypothetical protein
MTKYVALSAFFMLVLLTSSMFFAATTKGQSWLSEITPPSVQFSILNNSILYKSGNSSIGFTAIGCSANNMILFSSLYSVSIKTSWLIKPIQVFQWSEGSSNPSTNFFFYSIDLTNVSEGLQHIDVSVTSGGKNYGGGIYVGDFSLTSSATLNFTISPPPSSPTQPLQKSQTTPGWSFQLVDRNIANNLASGIGALGIVPIEVDSKANPIVACTYVPYDNAWSLVVISTWNGLCWSTQTVDLGNIYSLVLDKNDNPHLLYGGGKGLMYAYWNGSTWIKQLVDSELNFFGALALDQYDKPHVAYDNGTSVKYASLSGTNWNKEIIDRVNAQAVVFEVSLALDKSDIPYVFYGYPATEDTSKHNQEILKLATFRNGSWNTQLIDLGFSVDCYGNMVLDSKSDPHFVCSNSTMLKNYTLISTINYVSWNSGNWTTHKVASDALLINSPNTNWVRMGTLKLDSRGYPHIAYLRAGGSGHLWASLGSPMYASWTGKAWTVQMIDNNSATRPGFIAFDSNDSPYISYYGPINHSYGYHGLWAMADLKLAFSTEPTLSISNLPLSLTSIIVAAVIILLVAIVSLWSFRRLKKSNHTATKTPTVPELPFLVIVSLLLSVFVVAVIFRRRKMAN